uniref:Cupin type-1 domain-containing protein n=1 Tax=Leersia perrieri TaxID=77586 RepID=A0A0D9VG39_9ORYZ
MTPILAFLAAALLALCSVLVVAASDPSHLQDLCVADKSSPVRVNGVACKDAKDIIADYFFFSGLHMAGNTTNKQGSNVTAVNVAQVPGLNTLGVSLARIDYAPTVSTLFIHTPVPPRSSPCLRAPSMLALSSQNPGVITIGNVVFGSNPYISDDILAKAFQVEKTVVDQIQAQF